MATHRCHRRRGDRGGDHRQSVQQRWQHLITLVRIATGAWLLAGVLTAVERTGPRAAPRCQPPDDRRLVMPTSYFMARPFENWTRTQAALLGTVELDDILRETEMWDGRTNVLQVVDATNAVVRVSAKDAPTSWDLRCLVRERLVNWIQHHEPDSRPRIRLDDPRSGLSPRSPGEETIQQTS